MVGDRYRRGALVLHGLASNPRSAQGLVEALSAAGFRTTAPLLPGHGTTVDDLEACRWGDWVTAAAAAYEALAAECGSVVVIGLSMGGSVACHVATRNSSAIAGLVVVNPSVDPPAESYRSAMAGLLAAGTRRLPSTIAGMAGGNVGERGYNEVPVASLLTMYDGLDELFLGLPAIGCPTLIVTSRYDQVVPTVSSDLLAERVSGPVERLWLDRRHVATLDYDPGALRRTVDFAVAVTNGRSTA